MPLEAVQSLIEYRVDCAFEHFTIVAFLTIPSNDASLAAGVPQYRGQRPRGSPWSTPASRRKPAVERRCVQEIPFELGEAPAIGRMNTRATADALTDLKDVESLVPSCAHRPMRGAFCFIRQSSILVPDSCCAASSVPGEIFPGQCRYQL